MRLVRDPEAEAWIGALKASTSDFDWDAGNEDKNRKHGIDATQIEAMFEHPVAFAGLIIEPAHDEPRWLLLGRDHGGRSLALIFTRRGDRVRPISCRPMRREERKVYESAIGSE